MILLRADPGGPKNQFGIELYDSRHLQQVIAERVQIKTLSRLNKRQKYTNMMVHHGSLIRRIGHATIL